MARKIRAKLVMELREQSMSRRSIAKTRRMSMESVCEVFGIAEERGISWADVEPLTDEEAYRLFCPDGGASARASSRTRTGATRTRRWPRSA